MTGLTLCQGVRMVKRVVVWGTGFVGQMVIAEIVKHPLFELVGVGVSNPEKVGRDVGEICGLGATVGVRATDDIEALIALKPDALVHYGPTAAHADVNIDVITRFLRAGIDVCSTAMTPWVWPKMHLNPPNWIEPITEACEAGGASCFTTGIDPGFANDLFPMTLMGLCSEVRSVRASELLDYTNYTGDYEFEMGIGKPPEHRALLETPDILIFAWGATVPMIAHAAGIELDEITTTWDKWITPDERKSAKGIIPAGNVAAVRFTINGVYRGQTRIQLEHVNRIGLDAAPTGRPETTTTCTASTSREPRASRRRPRSGSPTVPAAMPPPRAVWPPACARSTLCPPSMNICQGG